MGYSFIKKKDYIKAILENPPDYLTFFYQRNSYELEDNTMLNTLKASMKHFRYKYRGQKFAYYTDDRRPGRVFFGYHDADGSMYCCG